MFCNLYLITSTLTRPGGPFCTALVQAPLQKRITWTRKRIVIMIWTYAKRIAQTPGLMRDKFPSEQVGSALLFHRRQRHDLSIFEVAICADPPNDCFDPNLFRTET